MPHPSNPLPVSSSSMRAMWRVMAVAAALTSAGCTKESATSVSDGAQRKIPAVEPSAASIEIVEIQWSSSNPSLGPHERTSSATVRPETFESPEAWNAAIATLLDETRINGVATLREYLVARRDQDAVRVAMIEGADEQDLREGGGYASVSFIIDASVSIRIDNLKRTRLAGDWERFWESHIRDEIEEEEPPTPKVGLEPAVPSLPL
jgi:hypothetical protein